MSTKLSNGVEYINPHFSEEFGEYLLSNKFNCLEYQGSLKFHLDGRLLVIKHDQVNLYIFHPEEEGQESEKWVFEQSHAGISQFNLFGWILLMHVMNVLSIRTFVTNAKKESVQLGTEADFIINSALISPLKKIAS